MFLGIPAIVTLPFIPGLLEEWHPADIQVDSPGAPVLPCGGFAEKEINNRKQAATIPKAESRVIFIGYL